MKIFSRIFFFSPQKLIPDSQCSGERLRPKLEEDEFALKVKSNLQQYIKSKRIVLGEVDTEKEEETVNVQDNEEVEDEDLYNTDEKLELPLHVRYATQVRLNKTAEFQLRS